MPPTGDVRGGLRGRGDGWGTADGTMRGRGSVRSVFVGDASVPVAEGRRAARSPSAPGATECRPDAGRPADPVMINTRLA